MSVMKVDASEAKSFLEGVWLLVEIQNRPIISNTSIFLRTLMIPYTQYVLFSKEFSYFRLIMAFYFVISYFDPIKSKANNCFDKEQKYGRINQGIYT